MTHGRIADALRARVDQKTHAVCHLTYCQALPDIAASGGLLSVERRSATPVHSWGDNEWIARDFVCASLMCNWGMIKHQADGREIAMVLINLLAMPDLSETRFVPCNTAAHRAVPYIVGEVDPINALDECLDGVDARKRSEILVRGGVPLSAIYGIVFCDQEAMDRWRPSLERAIPTGARGPELRIAVPAGRHFCLPQDYTVTSRPPATRNGEDQLHLDPPFDDWVGTAHWMDLEGQLEDLETARAERDAEHVSWADFYEDGEPDDPSWYELSVRD